MMGQKELRSLQGRANAKRGIQTEALVCQHMRALGFLCVEPIERAWTIQRRGGRIVGAFPREKISGDIIAIQPGGGGRAVHVEVKAPRGESLSYSAFRSHQVEAMERKADAGALALVAWVHVSGDIALMTWLAMRGAGFRHRRPLGWSEARGMRITGEMMR